MERFLILAQDSANIQNTAVEANVIAIISVVITIVLTAINIFLTVHINKNNSKQQERFHESSAELQREINNRNVELQKEINERNIEVQKQIHNRDINNQIRQNILETYGYYHDVLRNMVQVTSTIPFVFFEEQPYEQWLNSVTNAVSENLKKFNQLRLILDDDDFIKYLEKCNDCFDDFLNLAYNYKNSNNLTQFINNAWNEVSPPSAFTGTVIGYRNYNILYQNNLLIEKFWKHCSNTYIENIAKKAYECNSLVYCEEFDNKFKKYLQISDL